MRKGDIYWDSNNRTTKSIAMQIDNGGMSKKESKPEKSPLQYILSNEPLAWAWRSLLLMGIIFVLFASKRRQRVIPILPKNVNTSLAFIQNIGRLYYNTRNHNAICEMQFKQWQWFVRERYGLVTNNLLDEEFLNRLHQKSSIRIEQLQGLIFTGMNITERFATEKDLILLDKELRHFYNICK
jgi:hypothetical protein